jgi:hypothetical protein
MAGRASGAEEAQAAPDVPVQESLSQLIAKILDQLSITAWLPSGALIFVVVLYGSLREADGDLSDAIGMIGSMSFSSLVLLLAAVVVATTVTQAFEFESIRLLEGYWGKSRLASWLADRLCGRHIKRRRRFEERKNELDDALFAFARQGMLQRGIPRSTVDILEAKRSGEPLPEGCEEEWEQVRGFDWQQFALPPDVRRVHELTAWLESSYPPLDYRILPTRLGNTLRAYEERAYEPGSGSLEGMVQRVFHELPASLQSEHDQPRRRLDLYCSLFLVFALAASAAFPVLIDFGWELPAIAAGVGVSLAWLSYRAAIESARAYGSALEAIGSFCRSRSTGNDVPAVVEVRPWPNLLMWLLDRSGEV